MSSEFSKPVNLTTITTGLSGQNGANRWLNYQQDDFLFQDSVCFLYHSSGAAGLHPCPSTIQLLSVIENGHSPGYFPRLVGMISMLSVREDLVSYWFDALDMTGWTWASVGDVYAMFEHYIGVDSLSDEFGVVYREPDPAWVSLFLADGWRYSGGQENIGSNYLWGWTRDNAPGSRGTRAQLYTAFGTGRDSYMVGSTGKQRFPSPEHCSY